ncbi:MAG: protein with DOMON-like ligand-binding domain protein [Flavobacteriaceae bacterium]|nr:protein with DOMON-like ligand-binding domain protein [Flavobacteriaceae bacterium]|tara:strand:+ start:169093 stop:171519 length:2427 start_codon:yes stop_codon:yes gene_type:complete
MKFTILIITLCISFFTLSQEKKSLTINRTTNAPRIDGILDDDAWQNAEEAKDFTQFRPEMGLAEKKHQKSIVKMVYDDNAIYVGAYLYDNPGDIMKQFTSRDNFGQSDFFGVVLNPNNDAQNDTEFFVFSSGTQADAIANPSNGEDFGWNGVWDSSVQIVEDGWIVEMKIPYANLRFANQEIQTWGLQFHRRFRTDNSQYSWNPIDRTKGNIGLYHGVLNGIENISPPTRLSFYPFASTLIRTFDGETTDDYSLGMDVKYGLTENFTLDATLIPDFSQAGFDNVQLNLGPFEQTFSEQRQFFTEGVDLFSKGNLFYSRRIGGPPSSYPEIDEDNEELIGQPNKVKVLNAVKVSGRTKKGLGIGFFNAITEKTSAKIKNINTGEIREEVVEPFTNYNIMVVDQQFNKNSSVSLINTSVIRNGGFRDGNVTAALFDITDKANKWNVDGAVKMSNLNLPEDNQTGFSTSLEVEKVSGKYRYGIENVTADTKYNINDLGVLFRNNYNNFHAFGSYRIFEPTETFNNINVYIWAQYESLFKPSKYTGNEVGLDIYTQSTKLWEYGMNVNYKIGKQHDYFEPRREGYFFTFQNEMNVSTYMGTNYAKRLASFVNAGFATQFDPERDLFYYWIGAEPRMRFTDKFSLSYSINYQGGGGGRGFVTNLDDDIIFGERDQKTVTNSISGSYNFNPFHALSLSFRNYWATVTYDNPLFVLQEDGTLSTEDNILTTDISDPNINFNTWNLDFRYTWQFAPGSQLTALYRNSLFNSNAESSATYFESIERLFEQPIEHVFSLRVVYFIDYNNIKNVFKKNS